MPVLPSMMCKMCFIFLANSMRVAGFRSRSMTPEVRSWRTFFYNHMREERKGERQYSAWQCQPTKSNAVLRLCVTKGTQSSGALHLLDAFDNVLAVLLPPKTSPTYIVLLKSS